MKKLSVVSGKGVPREEVAKHFKKHWKFGIQFNTQRQKYITLKADPKNLQYIEDEDFSDEAINMFKKLPSVSNVKHVGDRDGQPLYEAEVQIYPGTKVWVSFDKDGVGLVTFDKKLPF